MLDRVTTGTERNWSVLDDQELVVLPNDNPIQKLVDAHLRSLGITTRRSAELRNIQAMISIGRGLSDMEPGSIQGLQLVVDDVHAARAELAGRGVEVSEVQDFPWGSFVFFSDPDGNGWNVQQIPWRQ